VAQVVIYRCRLAYALDHLGDTTAADQAYREALRYDPAWPRQLQARARQLADDPDEGRRDPLLAEEMAAQAARGEEAKAAEGNSHRAAKQATMGE
jgi:hypothetical protein